MPIAVVVGGYRQPGSNESELEFAWAKRSKPSCLDRRESTDFYRNLLTRAVRREANQKRKASHV